MDSTPAVSAIPTRRHAQAHRQHKETRTLEESRESSANVSQATLLFVPQVEDSGKTIACRAQNNVQSLRGPNERTQAVEDSWTLEVHYLPRVRLSLGEKLNEAQIREGNDVYFECSARARPQVSEIRWWFEGRELEANQSSGIIISNQSLVLQRVQRNRRGRYTCSAVNAIGESHSNSVHLRVHYSPFCKDQPATGEPEGDQFGSSSRQRHKTIYGVARLETVRVLCHVDADPIDSLTFKWAFVAGDSDRQKTLTDFRGQQLMLLEDKSIGRDKEPQSEPDQAPVSVATYTPRSELDYGYLLCWAHNSVGQQADPCVYRLVPAERPDPVASCRVVNASHAQLVVACEPGYDGGMRQSLQMEVYEPLRRELVANVTSRLIHNFQVPIVTEAPSELQLNSGDQQGDEPSRSRGGTDLAESKKMRQISTGGESASLVSSPDPNASSTSRQQKQRHPSGASSSSSGSRSADGAASVFVTDPILEPATSYLLSVYSVNPKGASKPFAFTASTSNLSAESGFGLARSDSRQARRLGK